VANKGVTKIADLLENDLSRPIEVVVNVTNNDPAGIREIVGLRVLRKKESQQDVLRKLFREHGESLNQNVKLEQCPRCTEFNEDEFVRLYPYVPHLIDISLDIVAGIRLDPSAPRQLTDGNGVIVKQSFEMIASARTRLVDQPVGVLVSIDKIYDLLEESLPPEKRESISLIRERFEQYLGYPGTPARVAKAICLMEFVKTGLPRTTKNVAALLVQRVTETPPVGVVAGILHQLKEAHLVVETENGWKLRDLDELRRATAALEQIKDAVGTVNPRLPGWHNDLIQLGKKSLARALNWYTRPMREFSASASRALKEIAWVLERLTTEMNSLERRSRKWDALENIPMDVVALEMRMACSEKTNAALARSMQEQIQLLREQVTLLLSLQNAAHLEVPSASVPASVPDGLASRKTAYVMGLCGTGRTYVCELIQQNMGERAKYFRDGIRFHTGPTPMIYSGHSTMKYVSRYQHAPEVTNRLMEAVRSGFADVIFIYRHPFDSLLTNWVYWRTYIRDYTGGGAVSLVYPNVDDLCADLELNFLEFKTFTEGDPAFFAAAEPGPPFLSFAEFVEETELYLQSPVRLTLRLEDFKTNPLREFSKIAEVMSIELDLHALRLAPPQTASYGYRAVKDKVPQFRDFIEGLNAETKRRIERIGYEF